MPVCLQLFQHHRIVSHSLRERERDREREGGGGGGGGGGGKLEEYITGRTEVW